jgi:hypothetical protein
MRTVGVVFAYLVGMYFVVRAVVELVTIDYRDAASYQADWSTMDHEGRAASKARVSATLSICRPASIKAPVRGNIRFGIPSRRLRNEGQDVSSARRTCGVAATQAAADRVTLRVEELDDRHSATL